MRQTDPNAATVRRRPARDAERGYVLLAFTLFAVILVAGAYKILPTMVFQGQRQKEDELIFRGMQYRRAIQLFVRKFGRYPGSLEDLENTNEIRFLRQRYPDPMTEGSEEEGAGEWRLIHIAPGGVFPDAINQPSAPGAGGQQTTEKTDVSSGETQPDPQGQQGLGTAQTSSATPQGGAQPRPVQAMQQSGVVGGIAGVASKSESPSIKRWNNYESYNEWEFIFDYRTDGLAQVAVNRATGVQQQQPGGQGQQGQQGQGQQRPGQQTPFNPLRPFGQQPPDPKQPGQLQPPPPPPPIQIPGGRGTRGF